MGRSKRPDLRAIPGGRSSPKGAETLRIEAATDDRPPFEIDILAVEDDTYAVLGSDPDFREPDEHPIRIWTRVHDMEETEPGTVVVEEGRRPKLRAVVHDLARDPTWREAWISAALDGILGQVHRRELASLGLEPLGCVYGRFSPQSFIRLLRRALERSQPAALRRIWIIAPPELLDALTAALADD
jgi:hypothetical protein